MHAKMMCVRIACLNGSIKVSRWLYSLGANIHIFDNYAFIYSCCNKHLDVAKWLYNLGADIHAKNDKAFKSACRYVQLKTAK